jgi:hypothetical protein
LCVAPVYVVFVLGLEVVTEIVASIPPR